MSRFLKKYRDAKDSVLKLCATKSMKKRLLFKKGIFAILIGLIVIIFFFFTFEKRISEVILYQPVKKIIQPFFSEREEQISDEELVNQAQKTVKLWYQASDENNEKKLKSLLAARWFRPARARQLKELLNYWLFSPEEFEKGHKGITRKIEFKFAKVFKDVYGRVVKLRVIVESEIWDSSGHHLVEGETTFIVTFEREKEGSPLEPRVRDITWRVLKDTKV